MTSGIDHIKRTASGAALTELILETFRFNWQLLSAGDRLMADLGLSSARWQVLGAIADTPLPVAQIARNMGLTRQIVQRTTNRLFADELVAFKPNPDHRRAKLVALTGHGHRMLEKVNRKQVQWSNLAARGIDATQLIEIVGIMQEIRTRLENRKGEST